MSNIKQVVVIRKDLKMRRGKEIAQGSHASMQFVLDRLTPGGRDGAFNVVFAPQEIEWLTGLHTKITATVNSEEELLELHSKAKANGLNSSLVQDAGLTEFAGVPTYTALAIGPDTSERIDPITGHLSLY